MLRQNNQVKEDIRHLLQVRTRIMHAAEAIQRAQGETLSNARRNILKRAALYNEAYAETIRAEYAVLDSLKNNLSDTANILLPTLSQRLAIFDQSFAQSDSLWTQYLIQEQASNARLYALDPSVQTFRHSTETENSYQLSSDTLAETLIEAENAYYQGPFLNYSHGGFQGAGYVDFTNRSDDFIEWKFSTRWNGWHLITFHYANSGSTDRPLLIRVDGMVVDSTWSFPSLRPLGWDHWVDNQPLKLHLEAGIHTLRLVAIGQSGANLDYLKVVAPAPYADSLSLPVSFRQEGIIDDTATVAVAQKALEKRAEINTMNGVEDILNAANNGVSKILQQILRRNDQLLRQDVTQLQWQLKKTNLFNFTSVALVALLAILATYLVLRSLHHSIARPVQQIQRLCQGETTVTIDATRDELNAVVQASNQLSDHLNQASEFARQVGEGNLSHPFKLSGENDVLGTALLQMRDKLHTIAQEDRKRNWQSEGLGQFAELLRKNHQDQRALAVAIVTHLVKYVKANQGGLFLHNDQQEEHSCLEMMGCYAYDRRKYLTKQIAIGEGLVGQTFLEGETIYLTEIPDSYLTIRSGLGGANPQSLLLVPIKTDKETLGVVELASFQEFAEYEIDLVEKIAQMVASSVLNLRMNERTKILLAETQAQTQALREQEEELRQNMEEMQATQEQLRRDTQSSDTATN